MILAVGFINVDIHCYFLDSLLSVFVVLSWIRRQVAWLFGYFSDFMFRFSFTAVELGVFPEESRQAVLTHLSRRPFHFQTFSYLFSGSETLPSLRAKMENIS